MKYKICIIVTMSSSVDNWIKPFINSYLENDFELTIICNATKEEAELLNVERGRGLLFMKNMFYDQNKKPVFFSKDVFNADYFELKFTLQDND